MLVHPPIEDATFSSIWCSSDARCQHSISRLLACAAALDALAVNAGHEHAHFQELLRQHLHASAIHTAEPQSSLLRLVPEQCALTAAAIALCREQDNMQVRLQKPAA